MPRISGASWKAGGHAVQQDIATKQGPAVIFSCPADPARWVKDLARPVAGAALLWMAPLGCAADAACTCWLPPVSPRPSARFKIVIMPKLLLNLRNVPDDEADDVRALLDANAIAHYDTKPSMWGISAGGIWVADDAAFAAAKRAMADYQRQRGARAREEYAAAKRAGTAETFISVLRAEPGRVGLIVLAILFLLGLMALPVILLYG